MRPIRLLPLLLVLPAGVAAQGARPASITDTYLRGRRALDSAVAHHGGMDAMVAASRIALVLEGHDHWRNQSRKAAGPFDREPFTGRLWLDVRGQRMVWQTTSAFVGGFRNANRNVIDSTRGFVANLRQGTWFPAANRQLMQQRAVVNRVPHVVLVVAMENAASARALGLHRLASGTTVDVVSISAPNGPYNLGLDPRTRELRALLGVQADAIAGDAAIETEFTEYTRQGGVLVPGRMVTRVAGEVVSDLRYRDVQLGVAVPDSLLQPPAGTTQAPPANPGEPVRELAPGVWAIRAAGYWALAVTLGDSIAVVEAGQGGGAETLAHLARLAPGKPVRWIVPTHHHDDHSGAVPEYLAAGATLVTTPGNRAYFGRMAAARSTLRPVVTKAVSSGARGAPRIETFTRTRALTGGGRTLELHDIGPSPHADEMVVAWLPAEGILFQGDLLNLPPTGLVPPNLPAETMRHFRDQVQAKGWQVRTLVGTHMAPGAFAQLEEAIAKTGTP